MNVAAPASDISSVNAVIVEPPSLPLNIKSLSDTTDEITKSLLESSNWPTWVPLSDILIPEGASKVIVPTTSTW